MNNYRLSISDYEEKLYLIHPNTTVVKSSFELMMFVLLTGIFSASLNSSFGQEPEKKVELLSSKIKEGDYSTKFIGQVKNNLQDKVEFVKVIATFYDEAGDMIGSDYTYTEPSDLQPNMKAPFEMFLDDDVGSQAQSYDITLTWQLPGNTDEYTNVIEASPQSQLQSDESNTDD
ncbi:MAG: FxLYD domain-containing protein [Nitrososphaeraceae archaeon]